MGTCPPRLDNLQTANTTRLVAPSPGRITYAIQMQHRLACLPVVVSALVTWLPMIVYWCTPPLLSAPRTHVVNRQLATLKRSLRIGAELHASGGEAGALDNQAKLLQQLSKVARRRRQLGVGGDARLSKVARRGRQLGLSKVARRGRQLGVLGRMAVKGGTTWAAAWGVGGRTAVKGGATWAAAWGMGTHGCQRWHDVGGSLGWGDTRLDLQLAVRGCRPH
eukprot:366563-Chlamydomonas_euryale.AAC.10